MSEKNQQIQDLLAQYIDKTISKEDFNLLFEYILKEENKALLDDFMKNSEKTAFPDAEAHQVDWPYMYNHIVADQKNKTNFSWMIRYGQKLTIAAALILIVYIGYQHYNHKRTIPSIQVSAKHDVAPGSDKAILKLADGSEIVLNDSKTGELAIQGAANINKNDKDFIAYTATNATNDKKVYTNVLTTPRGGQYRLMLPDQTLVWLNAESSITFPTAFIGKERKVKITGEVYFEVSKNKNKPFIVESDLAEVEVLGTHFNFNAYPNEGHGAVTLLEGAIRLVRGKSSKLITPGQQATFNANADFISIKNVDIDNVVDWKNGLFIFEDSSIKEVMRQVERWYDVKVNYAGKIPNVKFNGVISRDNPLSKLIKLLQVAGNVSFDIQPKTITIKQTNNYELNSTVR
jgi:transmembrane sensor